MKKNKTLIKEIRKILHYHQMMVRVDLRAARAGVRKCKELGEQMRLLQSGKAVEHNAHPTAETVREKHHCPSCDDWEE